MLVPHLPYPLPVNQFMIKPYKTGTSELPVFINVSMATFVIFLREVGIEVESVEQFDIYWNKTFKKIFLGIRETSEIFIGNMETQALF